MPIFSPGDFFTRGFIIPPWSLRSSRPAQPPAGVTFSSGQDSGKLLFNIHAIRRGGYQPPAQYKLKIARNVGRIRTSFPHLYHSTIHSIYQPGGRLVAAPTNGVYIFCPPNNNSPDNTRPITEIKR